MFVAKNEFLSLEEMEQNARYIWTFLSQRGWSMNAVAGMLGNMEVESTINPAIWQNLDEGNASLGFGLVQWTPATKLIEWASEQGLDYTHMDTQLLRILYEVENGIQWITTLEYPLSFEQFKTSTLSPFYLAGAFLTNYERPAEPDPQARGELGEKWFSFLGGVVIEPDEPKKKGLPLWVKYAVTRR